MTVSKRRDWTEFLTPVEARAYAELVALKLYHLRKAKALSKEMRTYLDRGYTRRRSAEQKEKENANERPVV